MTWSRWPFHPVVLALGWVLAGFVDSGVHPLAAPRVLALAIGAALVLQAIGWLITRSPHLGALIASAAILLLISPDLARMAIAIVLIGLAVAAAWMARRIFGHPQSAAEVTAGMNALTLAIVLLTGIRGIGNGSLPVAFADLTTPSREPASSPDANLPDVHVVLLDAYPRTDTLARLFNFDNSDFEGELEARGFTIAPQAHSNYMYTDLTLTAMFNGRHIVDIPTLAPLIGKEHQPANLRDALNDAPMLELARDHGYTVIANAPVGEGIALRGAADVFLGGSGLNEYERYMLASTFIGRVMVTANPRLPQDLWASWVDDGIASIGQAAAVRTDGPKLVFTHIPSPHLPIVFDRKGGPADAPFGGDFAPPEGPADPAFRAAYLAQLQYLNDAVLHALDAAPIDDNAIVIVLSDHGSESKLDWFNPRNGDLRERFASFFASRTPGDDAFPADMSPTNLFPILLGRLLAQDLPRADDRYFVSQGHWVLRTLEEIQSPFSSVAKRPEK
jgi:hypothetical protein